MIRSEYHCLGCTTKVTLIWSNYIVDGVEIADAPVIVCQLCGDYLLPTTTQEN